MSGRLTWDQIKQQYPHRYVGLTKIKRNPDNNFIESAKVLCTSDDTNYEEMLSMALDGKIYMLYSSDDEICAGVAE